MYMLAFCWDMGFWGIAVIRGGSFAKRLLLMRCCYYTHQTYILYYIFRCICDIFCHTAEMEVRVVYCLDHGIAWIWPTENSVYIHKQPHRVHNYYSRFARVSYGKLDIYMKYDRPSHAWAEICMLRKQNGFVLRLVLNYFSFSCATMMNWCFVFWVQKVFFWVAKTISPMQRIYV